MFFDIPHSLNVNIVRKETILILKESRIQKDVKKNLTDTVVLEQLYHVQHLIEISCFSPLHSNKFIFGLFLCILMMLNHQ